MMSTLSSIVEYYVSNVFIDSEILSEKLKSPRTTANMVSMLAPTSTMKITLRKPLKKPVKS